jgi:2-keto-3-deoxy-L-rhamnonate aldolase RhmA
VPSLDEAWFKRCLDIGACGVIVPQIRGGADAERVLQYCKYPPQGARSAGTGRAQGYGLAFQDYVARANDEVAVILQIEHIDAVEDIDRILQVAGIDCLFVGPYDLSASMGKIGLVDDPEVQAAIAHVSQRVKGARIPLGIFGGAPQAVLPYVEEGFTLVTVGTDMMLLGGAAKQVVDSFSG